MNQTRQVVRILALEGDLLVGVETETEGGSVARNFVVFSVNGVHPDDGFELCDNTIDMAINAAEQQDAEQAVVLTQRHTNNT